MTQTLLESSQEHHTDEDLVPLAQAIGAGLVGNGALVELHEIVAEVRSPKRFGIIPVKAEVAVNDSFSDTAHPITGEIVLPETNGQGIRIIQQGDETKTPVSILLDKIVTFGNGSQAKVVTTVRSAA